ncbi:hypothetical protein CPB85DRAFT_233762 [Mucidula mucida]|nr:hypothetical protein CPB85DRAFT_233762 [Mucidula mucida]
MVANAVALLLGVLALGQQVVLAKRFKFNFDNNVTQCEPVSISFRGSEVPADSIPVTLTILPLSAPPIAIDIPNAAINSSGVYVTFFPLPAGTQFLASLDDAEGQNSARVSDLYRVLDSDDASCLPPVESTTSSSLFSISENIEQCNTFSVQYNTTTAPSIRLLEPKGKSFLLPLQSDDTELKTASYLMNFSRQHDVVLMLDSGTNQKNTTSLLHSTHYFRDTECS